MSHFDTNDIHTEIEYPKNLRDKLAKYKMHLFVIGFILSAFHLVNYEGHAFSIIGIQLKSAIGLADASDYAEKASLCNDLKKFSCFEQATYSKALLTKDPQDLLNAGSIQRKMKHYRLAIQSYEEALKYLSRTEHEPLKVAIHAGLARSYEALDQSHEAITHYDLAIKEKPEVILITVTKDYVTLLKKLGKSERAEQVIKEARKRAKRDELFANI